MGDQNFSDRLGQPMQRAVANEAIEMAKTVASGDCFFSRIGSIMLVTLLVGCASTEITGFRDPAYETTSFSTPVVLVQTTDLGWRKKLEQEIVSSLKWNRITAISSTVVAPPTRGPIDWESFPAQLAERGYDSLIVVGITDTDVDKSYTPVRFGATYQTGSATATRGGASFLSTAYTPQFGGKRVQIPSMILDTSVYDTKTMDKAWISTSRTGGKKTHDFDDLRQHFSNTLGRQLTKERLFVRAD